MNIISQDSLDLESAELFENKSVFYSNLNLDSSLLYSIKAYDIYIKKDSINQIASCLNTQLNLYLSFNNMIEVEKVANELKSITNKINNKEVKLTSINNLGAFERIKGNNKSAIKILSTGLNIVEDKNIKTSLYQNLGFVYLLNGDYLQAEKSFNNAAKIQIDYPKYSSYFLPFIYNALSKVMKYKRNYEKVIYFSDLGLDLINMDNKDPNLISIKTDLFIQKSQSKIELNRTDNLLEKLNSKLNDNINDYQKAEILILTGRLKSKLKLFNHSTNDFKKADSLFKEKMLIEQSINKRVECKIEIANNFTQMKLFTNAIDILDSCLKLINKNHSFNSMLIRVLAKKVFLLNLVKHESLDTTFLNLKNLIRSLRQQNSSASHKDFWANENLEIYQEAIGAFVERGDLNTAFTFAEENKSNLLIQSLNDLDAKTYAGIPEELLDKERESRAKLQFYQKKKFELENNDDIDSSKLFSYTETITKTEFNLEAIVDTLEAEYPEYFEIKYNEEDLTVDDIQNLLDTQTGFIEYFVGKDSSYVFTITKNNVSVNTLENLNDHSNVFLNYYNSIDNPSTSLDSIKYYSDKVNNLIWKKAIEDLDDNIKNIVIVPDDILNNLPFELLKEKTNDTYSGLKYNIQYQYSGRLWRLLKNRISENKEFDFLGYAYNTEKLDYLAERACSNNDASNLLCSEREVASITKILKGKNLSLDFGRKGDILKNAANAKIIHLATHSCLDNENSDYSRIFFDDGYITNIDLQLYKLNADLAVLSACESGYGELVKGEGAMSISKGFFHAGCKSTLVSLWPVDDCSTSDFMKHFYTFLLKGHKKDVALKKAKQLYVETAHPSRTHPYYWAGFILMGDNTAIWKDNSSLYLLCVLAFVTLVAFLLYHNKSRNSA